MARLMRAIQFGQRMLASKMDGPDEPGHDKHGGVL
jgi:hypothetical protein